MQPGQNDVLQMNISNYTRSMTTPQKPRFLRRRVGFVAVLALGAVVVWLSASYIRPQASWLHWLIVWLMCAVPAYVLHPWMPGFLQRRRERRQAVLE